MKYQERPGHEIIQVWSKVGTLKNKKAKVTDIARKKKPRKIWSMVKFVKKTVPVITYVEGNWHPWNYNTGNSQSQDQGKHFTFYLTTYKIKFS